MDLPKGSVWAILLPDKNIEMWGGSMTTIYLIRHAEAEGNLYRIAQGQ